MTGAILWKEYREQRAIWLALLALPILVWFALPWLVTIEPGPGSLQNMFLTIICLILAWTYGLVCGGMLFAGEREAQTEWFLDALPTSRFRIWCAKAAAGLTLVLSFLSLLALMLLLAWYFNQLPDIGALLVMLSLTGLIGLGWGLLFSGQANSVLSAIGLAILGQVLGTILVSVLTFLPLVVLMHWGLEAPGDWWGGLSISVVALLPWVISARLYSRVDRVRRAEPRSQPSRLAQWLHGWGSVWWLSWTQLRSFPYWLGGFCFIGGLLPLLGGFAYWPILTLLIGLVCGATCLADEQTGAYRFLGDQRLPLTRFWLVKTSVRAALGLTGVLILFIPSFVVLAVAPDQAWSQGGASDRFVHRLFRSELVGLTIPVGLFLFAPWIYGLALGSLCGLLFRKRIIALFVAFGLSVLLLSVWVPSFFAGGLHAWQVLSVPTVLLMTVPPLLRRWAGERLVSWGTAMRLTACSLACVGLTVGGLLARYAEIPDLGDPPGYAKFVEQLPSPEENEAGRAISTFLALAQPHVGLWETHTEIAPLFAEKNSPQSRVTPTQELLIIREFGWPELIPEGNLIERMLNDTFEQDFWKHLDEAVGKPVGVVNDPRQLSFLSRGVPRADPILLALLLEVRGLQRQKQGDPGDFVRQLERVLTLVGNLQNHGPRFALGQANFIEGALWKSLDRWLEALQGHAELLHRVGTILERHRAWLPTNYEDNILAEYLIAQNTLDSPDPWIRSCFRPLESTNVLQVNEADCLILSLKFPWERDRAIRLLRLQAKGDREIPQSPENAPWLYHFIPFVPYQGRLERSLPQRLVLLEAARLRVALRHHQAVTGRPAERLDELIPGSLRSLPLDPYSNQPFHYRLSAGEEIQWSARPENLKIKKILKGQGVLWSIGPDGQDNGGLVQGLDADGESATRAGEDLIFVVPMPARSAKP